MANKGRMITEIYRSEDVIQNDYYDAVNSAWEENRKTFQRMNEQEQLIRGIAPKDLADSIVADILTNAFGEGVYHLYMANFLPDEDTQEIMVYDSAIAQTVENLKLMSDDWYRIAVETFGAQAVARYLGVKV